MIVRLDATDDEVEAWLDALAARRDRAEQGPWRATARQFIDEMREGLDLDNLAGGLAALR